MVGTTRCSVGVERCNDCRKWKAHKAFVRSRVKHGSTLWTRNGYMWHKYKSCNRCFRIYRNRGMSVAEFIKVYGAEEHEKSEPEVLIDEEVDPQVVQAKPAKAIIKTKAKAPEPKKTAAARRFERHIKFDDIDEQFNFKWGRMLAWLDGASRTEAA